MLHLISHLSREIYPDHHRNKFPLVIAEFHPFWSFLITWKIDDKVVALEKQFLVSIETVPLTTAFLS